MQPYDIAMLAIIGVTALHGFWKGMAWQIAALASLIVSYFVALRFSPDLAPYLSQQAPYNRFIAMLLIYLGTSLGIWLIFRAVSNALDNLKLRDFDRQVGGLFGIAKGVVVCVVVTFFAVTLTAEGRALVLKSKSGVYIARLIHEATPIMPEELRAELGPSLEKLDRGLDPNQPDPPSALDPSQFLRQDAAWPVEATRSARLPQR